MLRRLSPGQARKIAQIALASLALLAENRNALAHHNVGHGAGESLRNLSALAGDPSPRQRAALMGQISRGTEEPTLNTATTYGLAALIELRAHRRLYLSAQFPLLFVDEDSTDGLKVGYGNTTVGVHVPLGSLKKNAASWVVGLNASLPTRTFSYESDPGTQWSLTPGIRHGDTFGNFLWYGLVVFPIETRPAGSAVDASPAAGIGYRFFRALSLTAGLNADIRALTICKTFDGAELCSSGRATEVNRPLGATRVHAHVGASLDLHKKWSVFAGGQLPITARRDIEWAANLGVEARF